MTDGIDLPAYLRRIGFQANDSGADQGKVRPDEVTLRSVVRLHASAIPFENLDPLLGRSVGLDMASVQRKLVMQGRGGWCFEQNLLLAHALRAIGFAVTGLAARVLWGRPDDAVTARSHMLLRIDLDDGPRIVDVGFGGLTLSGVLRLVAGPEQQTPHEAFRLLQRDGDWWMQSRLGDTWTTLYRFDLQPQHEVDYVFPNHYLSTHLDSHFRHHLMAARALPDRRLALRDREFSVRPVSGATVQTLLDTPQSVVEVLEREFGIAVPAGLAQALQPRLF